MALLNKERKAALVLIRAAILDTLNDLIKNTKEERLKELYRRVKRNVEILPINFRPGESL